MFAAIQLFALVGEQPVQSDALREVAVLQLAALPMALECAVPVVLDSIVCPSRKELCNGGPFVSMVLQQGDKMSETFFGDLQPLLPCISAIVQDFCAVQSRAHKQPLQRFGMRTCSCPSGYVRHQNGQDMEKILLTD